MSGRSALRAMMATPVQARVVRVWTLRAVRIERAVRRLAARLRPTVRVLRGSEEYPPSEMAASVQYWCALVPHHGPCRGHCSAGADHSVANATVRCVRRMENPGVQASAPGDGQAGGGMVGSGSAPYAQSTCYGRPRPGLLRDWQRIAGRLP